MVAEIFDNIYKVELQLPRSLVKSFNCYVIKGKDRNLMIDTGLNFMGALQQIQADLNHLSIDSNKTDFFITHMHADHIGLLGKLCGRESRVFASLKEAKGVRASHHWRRIRRFAMLSGFPKGQLDKAITHNPDYRYRPVEVSALDLFDLLEEGDTIEIKPYVFECIETPGHTAGHMCLYENEHKLLFSGDHVIGDITTPTQLWGFMGNPLKEYMESLSKVNELDVEMVLPGHSSVFLSLKGRIKQLLLYHQSKLREISLTLNNGRCDAYQLASKINWESISTPWDSLYPWQKLIATGESIAHLKYLEEMKAVMRMISNCLIEYSLLK